MNASIQANQSSSILGTFLTFLVLGVGVAVAANVKLPFLTSYRAGMIFLLVAGMAACTTGIGRVAAVNGWAHPISILGYLIGALILVIGLASLFGKPLPIISGERSALIAVLALMAGKWLLTQLHPLLR